MNQDDIYLVKMKQTGASDSRIAAKLNMQEKDVRERYAKIIQELQDRTDNGYAVFCEMFTVMANQYQLLGESLKLCGSFTGNVIQEEELKLLIDKDPVVTLRNLQTKCIVLAPYIPISPEESIRRTLAGN